MGSLVGHIVPGKIFSFKKIKFYSRIYDLSFSGSFFLIFSIWWILNIFSKYFKCYFELKATGKCKKPVSCSIPKINLFGTIKLFGFRIFRLIPVRQIVSSFCTLRVRKGEICFGGVGWVRLG